MLNNYKRMIKGITEGAMESGWGIGVICDAPFSSEDNQDKVIAFVVYCPGFIDIQEIGAALDMSVQDTGPTVRGRSHFETKYH